MFGQNGRGKQSGRTVLFVSHDKNAVEQLCSKVIIPQNGRKNQEGATHALISNYLNSNKKQSIGKLFLTEDIQLTEFFFNCNGIISGSDLHFNITLDCSKSRKLLFQIFAY